MLACDQRVDRVVPPPPPVGRIYCTGTCILVGDLIKPWSRLESSGVMGASKGRVSSLRTNCSLTLYATPPHCIEALRARGDTTLLHQHARPRSPPSWLRTVLQASRRSAGACSACIAARRRICSCSKAQNVDILTAHTGAGGWRGCGAPRWSAEVLTGTPGGPGGATLPANHGLSRRRCHILQCMYIVYWNSYAV